MSVCTGRTCLPFAKVWIPWHHKPRTDPIAPGGISLDLWIALPKIPQHVRLDWDPVSHQLADDQQWQEMSQREKSGLYAICCCMAATESLFRVPFICLWMGSGTSFLWVLHIPFFFAMSSSFFQDNHMFPNLFCSVLSKMPLMSGAIKPNQRNRSFLTGHVQSA